MSERLKDTLTAATETASEQCPPFQMNRDICPTKELGNTSD